MSGALDELRAHPHDRIRHLAYADWLQARGEPHGELMALQIAAQTCEGLASFESLRARAHALFESEPSLQMDPRPKDGRPLGVWASWRWGFVRQLELCFDERWLGRGPGGRPSDALIEAFVRLIGHPCLALLTDLRIHAHHMNTIGLGILVANGLSHHRERGHRLPRVECISHHPHGYMVQTLLESYRLPVSSGADTVPRLESAAGGPVSQAFLAAVDVLSKQTDFALLWADARGPCLRVYRGFSFDGMSPFIQRHLSLALNASDRLIERRIASLLDGLVFLFDESGRSGGPRPAWTRVPCRTSPEAACDELAGLCGRGSSSTWRALVRLLPQAQTWMRVSESMDARSRDRARFTTWEGLIGVGPDWVMCLAGPV